MLGSWGGHKSTILSLLLLIPTAMFLLSTSLMTDAETIYKPGDWLQYRLIFNYAGKECTYLIRITVKNIRETTVFYSVSLEKIEKQDDVLLCGFYHPVVGNYTFDISQATPESRREFINPAYTGEYKISEATTVRYYKGILTYLEETSTEPVAGFTRLQLIDTSIQELKALNKPLGMSITMIGLILIIVVLATITILIVARKQYKTTETLLNQSQGA